LKPFDHAGEFQGRGEDAGLARLTVRNAGITIFAQGFGFVIQLTGAIILARILTPSDFGLVTMVTTFSLLLASFGLAGLTEAVLQAEKINHSLVSNLFWINIGGGLVLAGAFGAAGSLLARFYGNPHIKNVAIGFSLAIFFAIAPVVHLSLVKRAMRFSATSLNDIISRVAYVLTAICCACLGWRYWALVAGAIVQPIVVCVGAWILCPWIPGLPRKVQGTGKMVRYAINVYGRFSLNYGTGNVDNLLVGWHFGAQALGFYKKAFDLFILPSCQLLSPILAVVVTTLSRKNKDIDQYKRYFLKGLGLVAFVGMAASADLTLIGPDLVRLLLGPKWGESGRIFRYFAPGVGIMLVYQTQCWIHLSIGTAGRWLRWTLIELTVTLMLFLLALRWGPAGIAGAWTGSFCIMAIPAFWYAGKPIGLQVTSVLGSIWRYIVASAIAGLACAALLASMPWLPLVTSSGPAGAIARIVTNSALFTLLYLATIVALYGGLDPLREVGRLLPDLVPGIRRFSRSSSVEVSEHVRNDAPVKSIQREVTFDSKY
jgi:O-antigen/teichoic acid export membrane protein